MSTSSPHSSNPTVSSARLERKLRLSLPEKEKLPPSESAAGTRRNTISEDSLPRVRKKSKTPVTASIPEDDDETVDRYPEVVIVNELKPKIEFVNRSASNVSKQSAVSSKSTKSTFTYDNAAFEGSIKTPSTPIGGRLQSRTPSVRSLEVYREQYCCCAKRTKCEKYLLVTVTILSIIVIVLVIVIAVLARDNSIQTYKMFNEKL